MLQMLQYYSRNRPTAIDEKKNFILVVISLVGSISEKSLKLLPPDVTFYS